MAEPPRGRLELAGVSKSYPGVRALDSVDFDLRAGEVHVLLGENGAGKSTLIKIMAGVHRPDGGVVRVDGEQVRLSGPDHAERLGISTIHQEMALVGQLTVAENIYLGRPPRRFGVVDHARMRRQARELLDRTGLDLDVDAVVGELGVAQRQLVEIAKALSLDTRFLIMDEPTAVLSRTEAGRLFELVGDLARDGVGVVFISHLLDEVGEIGDRVTVLRDGAKVGEVPASTDPGELVRLMVGRAIDQQYPPRESRIGDTRLEVRGLGTDGVLEDITFSARAGEVVGIGGLVGAGRTELVRAIFGADRYDRGEVRVGGRSIPRGDIAAARAAGLALVPEDRAGQGLVLGGSVEENLGLATLGERTRGGLVDRAEQRRAAEKSVRDLRIRVAGLDQHVVTLSGGNQQKIVIGKWLLARPRVLILDEPTRGIDVGARAEIYELINELTRDGTTVVVVSSDLPELLGISDRVLVMADGRLRGELDGAEATQERVMALAVSNNTQGDSDA
ncbi:monosaccharide ABC transporter ATP-binding protein (CUT2 family) [Saccharopolyspora erythraea NRRL 2338]|uniref:ABC transporter protein, ATP binding component n=2 Tax=Saccharopolyspora erythraea TaxID=1836 RepID=A4FLC0_SACEN|nr:sugar ABC transporter ATP-binding protein [Saccharopolyspora erythraea]EQD83788.1 D-ribose transporter ATP binding protein [Saccharopolyspora erythraea D]PFG98485.1 monosaccharide ABC transporter ATP-binding protein (CUT2 family) [Saccharopolyspora erythraea NRRL 2338]QRK88541.1 sugar ABC transporter ATP-binding protein [Saccharopolyspora erythraea]CAM04845.1 ABC transporter protein, ATP binding component [Saccharopolyspora erythraea NRRL 2338]